jgi:hypothetical protein
MDTLHISLPPLRAKERALLCALLRQPVVPKTRIIDALWADSPDGGPENPNSSLKVYLHGLRQKLLPLGITIRLVERGYSDTSLYGLEGIAIEALRSAVEARYGAEILKNARVA